MSEAATSQTEARVPAARLAAFITRAFVAAGLPKKTPKSSPA